MYAEPSLAFFADEPLQDAKGSPLLLGGATAKREGEFVLLNVPEEVQTSVKQRFQQTKLQAGSEAARRTSEFRVYFSQKRQADQESPQGAAPGEQLAGFRPPPSRAPRGPVWSAQPEKVVGRAGGAHWVMIRSMGNAPWALTTRGSFELDSYIVLGF